MGEYIKERLNKFNRSKDVIEDLRAFHGLEAVQTLLDIYNWPEDGSVGYGVSFIYHLILDSGIKVKRVRREGESYIVEFDVEMEDPWAPKRIQLTPRPEK